MAQRTKRKVRTAAPAPASGTPEAPLPGQITQPNPLELLWEKYKKQIVAVLVLIAAVIAGFRVRDYVERLERNRVWRTFTEATGLSAHFAPTGWNAFELMPFLYRVYREFPEPLARVAPERIEAALAELAGTPAEAHALWLLACRHMLDGNSDGVRGALERLASLAPSHFTLAERPWPPVYVEVPKDEDAENGNQKTRKRPKVEPPPPASLRRLLEEIVGREAEFRAAHPDLYHPPEPAPKPTIEFETTQGSFKVRLYPDRAPKHCAQFLENCKEKWYEGLRVHRIERRPDDPQQVATYQGDLIFLGDPTTRTEDDTNKWGRFHSKETIEHEDSGLSHFPFMVAFDREATRLGSDRRVIYFTASDAIQRDDAYVVFGRVVEGQDVLEAIARTPFNSTSEEKLGKGVPGEEIKVLSVRVVE